MQEMTKQDTQNYWFFGPKMAPKIDRKYNSFFIDFRSPFFGRCFLTGAPFLMDVSCEMQVSRRAILQFWRKKWVQNGAENRPKLRMKIQQFLTPIFDPFFAQGRVRPGLAWERKEREIALLLKWSACAVFCASWRFAWSNGALPSVPSLKMVVKHKKILFFWAIGNNPEQCWAMLSNPEQSCAIMSNSKQSWAILSNPKQSWAILSNPEQCWAILSNPSNSEQSWENLSNPDQSWAILCNPQQSWQS